MEASSSWAEAPWCRNLCAGVSLKQRDPGAAVLWNAPASGALLLTDGTYTLLSRVLPAGAGQTLAALWEAGTGERQHSGADCSGPLLGFLLGLQGCKVAPGCSPDVPSDCAAWQPQQQSSSQRADSP